MKKLRLLHFVVQPVIVIDDGDALSPGPQIQPQVLTMSGLSELMLNWPAKLKDIEIQAGIKPEEDVEKDDN